MNTHERYMRLALNLALKAKFKPGMEAAVKEFSWINAAQKMIDMCEGKAQPYKPGTVKL